MAIDLHVLPAKKAVDEQAFVDAWMAHDDAELLSQVISDAIEARRPKLAARLVQLIGEQVEIEPGSALERAQQAANMLVLRAKDIELFNALDEAWRETRKNRMRRIRARQRLTGHNKQYTIPRVGRNPRKR